MRDLLTSYLFGYGLHMFYDLACSIFIWAVYLLVVLDLGKRSHRYFFVLLTLLFSSVLTNSNKYESLINVYVFIRFLPLLFLAKRFALHSLLKRHYFWMFSFISAVVLVQVIFDNEFLRPLNTGLHNIVVLHNTHEISAIFNNTISLAYFILIGYLAYPRSNILVIVFSLWMLLKSGVVLSALLFVILLWMRLRTIISSGLRLLTGSSAILIGVVTIYKYYSDIIDLIFFVATKQRGLLLTSIILPNVSWETFFLGRGGSIKNLLSDFTLSKGLNTDYYLSIVEDIYLFVFPIYFGIWALLLYILLLRRIYTVNNLVILTFIIVLGITNQAPENMIFAFLLYAIVPGASTRFGPDHRLDG